MFSALAVGLVLHAQPVTCRRTCDPGLTEEGPVAADGASALSLSVEMFSWRFDGLERDASRLTALVSLTFRPDALWLPERSAPTPPRRLPRPRDVCGGHGR